MSEATIEALESEAFEGTGEAGYEGEAFGEAGYEGEALGEAGYEGEALGEAGYEAYGEAARSDARRRERQRQIMLARQRQAMLARQRQAPSRRPQPARRPAVTTPTPAVRAVRSEVQSLDLQTKVALDSLRSRLDEANRLAYRNAWAAEASAAASQILDSFPGLEPHDWAKALIRGAPTLLIAPGKRRRPGIEGILFDPRVAGGAVLAGIWAIGHFRNAPENAADIIINPIPPAQLEAGSPGGKLTGYAVDKNGNQITRTTISISWNSQDQTILQVATDGTFSALNPGPTLIIATGGGFTKRQPVTVTPAAP